MTHSSRGHRQKIYSLIAFCAFSFSAASATAAVTSRTSSRSARTSFQGEISSSLSRGFDYYSDYFSTLGASLGYRISNDLLLSGEVEYKHVFTEFEERHTDSFEDMAISLRHYRLFREPESGFNIDGSVSVRLPTSEVSRRTGLRFATAAGVHLSLPVGRVRFSQTTTYTYYNQQYDTADEAGLEPNPIHGVGLGLGIFVALTDWLTWSVSGQLHTIWDLESDRDQIEAFSSALVAEIDKIWSLSLAVQTRNKILSNNSMFDEDTTITTLGLSARI